MDPQKILLKSIKSRYSLILEKTMELPLSSPVFEIATKSLISLHDEIEELESKIIQRELVEKTFINYNQN